MGEPFHIGEKTKAMTVDVGLLVIKGEFYFPRQLWAVAEVSIMSNFHLLDAWKGLLRH